MTTEQRNELLAELRAHSERSWGQPTWAAVTFLLAELDAARAREADFHMQYRMKCDVESKALLVRAEQAEAREAKLREALKKTAPYSCAECGEHVKVDEDGCCTMCGGDAALAEGEEQ